MVDLIKIADDEIARLNDELRAMRAQRAWLHAGMNEAKRPAANGVDTEAERETLNAKIKASANPWPLGTAEKIAEATKPKSARKPRAPRGSGETLASAVLADLDAEGGTKAADIATSLHADPRSVSMALQSLKRAGKAQLIDGYWYRAKTGAPATEARELTPGADAERFHDAGDIGERDAA